MRLQVGTKALQSVFRKELSEVDDVIHNTIGCFIGYSLWLMIQGSGLKETCCWDDMDLYI